MLNKLAILLCCLSTGVGAINIKAEAEQESQIGVTEMNVWNGVQWLYDAAEPTQTPAHSDRFNKYVVTRNVTHSAEEVLGPIYNIPFLDENAYHVDQDTFHLDTMNTNIFIDKDSEIRLSISYDYNVFNKLRDLAIDKGIKYVIPGVYFDSEIAAVFTISPTEFSLSYDKSKFNDVAFYYAEENVNYGLWYHTGHLENYEILFDIKANAYQKISEISTISSEPYETSKYYWGGDYTYSKMEFDLGYIPSRNQAGYLSWRAFYFKTPLYHYPNPSLKSNALVAPFDITYFNPSEGQIVIGHTHDSTEYGIDRTHYELTALAFEMDGETTLLTKMNESEYETLQECNGVYPSSLANKFYFGPRYANDDEQGYGTGGLVWTNCIPVTDVFYSDKTQIVNIVNFSWRYIGNLNNSGCAYLTTIDNTDLAECEKSYDQLLGLVAIKDQYGVVTRLFKDGDVSFKYYADKCIGYTHVSLYELNMNTSEESPEYVDVTKVEIDWSSPGFWIIGILTGGASIGTAAASTAITNGIENAITHKNVQRFYFNAFNSQNQLLPNIQKLQMAYQQGGSEYLDHPRSNNLDDWRIEEYEVQSEEELFTIHADWSTSVFGLQTENASNGFASCYDDPAELGGVDYHWFYQNIYNAENNDDFICFWRPLSIWYEADSGKVERLTTNSDGLYLAKDENDNYVVWDMTTDEEADISVEDFINYGDFDVEVVHSEDPEDPSVVTDIQNWWDDLKNALTNSKFMKALKIIAIIAASLIALIVVIKIISWISKSRDKRDAKRYRNRRK